MKRSEHRALFERTPHNAELTAEVERLREVARRGELSYGEIHDLQNGLVAHIDPDDVELLPWAGVDEFDD